MKTLATVNLYTLDSCNFLKRLLQITTRIAAIYSRREMMERTNAAIMRLSLLDCHFESHVSMNNKFEH